MSGDSERFRRHNRGFESAAGILKNRIRVASEARGFAVTRLLTHWAEVVGEETAAMALPVKVGFGREGFGATLTLLTTGAFAPLLQMQLPKIRDKVNACYGYNAISKVVITQTAPTGFAEGQVAFTPAPKPAPAAADPVTRAKARAVAAGVQDETLRAALEALGESVLSRSRQTKG